MKAIRVETLGGPEVLKFVDDLIGNGIVHDAAA